MNRGALKILCIFTPKLFREKVIQSQSMRTNCYSGACDARSKIYYLKLGLYLKAGKKIKVDDWQLLIG